MISTIISVGLAGLLSLSSFVFDATACPMCLELKERSSISDIIEECCSKYPNLRPELVDAVISYESDYDPTSTDPNDPTVSGLMQVSATWHSDRAESLGVSLDTNYGNILTGCDFLSELIEACGDERYALMCYNGGVAFGTRHWNRGDITEYAQTIYDLSMKGGR